MAIMTVLKPLAMEHLMLHEEDTILKQSSSKDATSFPKQVRGKGRGREGRSNGHISSRPLAQPKLASATCTNLQNGVQPTIAKSSHSGRAQSGDTEPSIRGQSNDFKPSGSRGRGRKQSSVRPFRGSKQQEQEHQSPNARQQSKQISSSRQNRTPRSTVDTTTKSDPSPRKRPASTKQALAPVASFQALSLLPSRDDHLHRNGPDLMSRGSTQFPIPSPMGYAASFSSDQFIPRGAGVLWQPPVEQPVRSMDISAAPIADKVENNTKVYQNSPLSYIYLNGHQQTTSTGPFPPTIAMESIIHTLNHSYGFMYISAMQNILLPVNLLEENGYRTTNLTERELGDKRRCIGCGKFWGKLRAGEQRAAQKVYNLQQAKNEFARQGKISADSKCTTKEKAASEKKPELRCKFHSGTLIKQQGHGTSYKRVWSCCNQQPSADPCTGSEHHEPAELNLAALSKEWQFYPAPSPTANTSYRAAIALDCEMGTSKTGDSELIRLTVLDFFTSEILIDNLVYPSTPMQHLRTQYSGVTWDMLNDASRRGRCIRGRDAARREIFRYVGPDTIVIAHSGNNDLACLRWRHTRVVDTFLIEDIPERARLKELKRQQEEDKKMKEPSEKRGKIIEGRGDDEEKDEEFNENGRDTKQSTNAKNKTQPSKHGEKDEGPKPKKVKGSGKFSLKTLSKQRLGRDIQTGSSGHDSLEDALAARDLAHWLVRRALETRPAAEPAAPLPAQVRTGYIGVMGSL